MKLEHVKSVFSVLAITALAKGFTSAVLVKFKRHVVLGFHFQNTLQTKTLQGRIWNFNDVDFRWNWHTLLVTWKGMWTHMQWSRWSVCIAVETLIHLMHEKESTRIDLIAFHFKMNDQRKYIFQINMNVIATQIQFHLRPRLEICFSQRRRRRTSHKRLSQFVNGEKVPLKFAAPKAAQLIFSVLPQISFLPIVHLVGDLSRDEKSSLNFRSQTFGSLELWPPPTVD